MNFLPQTCLGGSCCSDIPGTELRVNRLKPFCKVHLDKGTQYCFQLAGREASSPGYGLHHRAVRDQKVRHLQPRARSSCNIERVPGTLEAPRSDNPTWMILEAHRLQSVFESIEESAIEWLLPIYR